MKITGVSFGTKNGGSEVLCKAALMAAREAGAEAEFIRLPDWNIEYCTGCAECSRDLVTGRGNACVLRDDFDAFFGMLLDADGVLFVSPVFEAGAAGLLRTVCDRFGLRMDRGMNTVGDRLSRDNGGAGIDPRLLKDKVISFIGVGGPGGGLRVRTDHAICAMSPGWKIIDNDFFPWSNDIILQDDRLERAGEIGRNLVRAAADPANAEYMGGPGVCPHCHGSGFWLEPGTSKAVCECCGLEGEAVVEGGAWKFVFPPEDEEHARDMLQGKLLHADRIREEEERYTELDKDPVFAERRDHYRDLFEPVPPPVK